MYTDSKYASLVLHAHATVWKEINYITANGSPIKYHESDRLLCTVFLPKEVAVTHYQGYQKRVDEVSEGNCWANYAAQEAAQTTQSTITIAPCFGSIP